jgi:hypothetical protein
MEGRQVQGDIDPQVLGDPVAHAGDLVGRVVLAGDHQGGELEPDLGLALEVEQGVQHGLEVGEAELVVEALGEGLQVDVGCVHAGEEFRPGFGGDVARRDRHGPQARPAALAGRVQGILGPGHGVVVGEGHASAAQAQGGLGDLSGGGLFTEGLDLVGLAHMPVLAEAAAQVASGRPEGEHAGAGQEVVQGLLLDGVHAEARAATPGGQDQASALVLTHEAEATLPVSEPACSRAQMAFEGAVLERRPPAAGMGGRLAGFSHPNRLRLQSTTPGSPSWGPIQTRWEASRKFFGEVRT